jgi:hypothetical protein
MYTHTCSHPHHQTQSELADFQHLDLTDSEPTKPNGTAQAGTLGGAQAPVPAPDAPRPPATTKSVCVRLQRALVAVRVRVWMCV